MTNSTVAFWDVDGTSLQTYARNIATLTGRSGVPTFRGNNTRIAYRGGETWYAKQVEPKTLALAMWVAGCNDDGTPPTEYGQQLKYQKNWRELRQLLWRDDSAMFTLTKRWIDPDTGNLLSASALVENISDMEPMMHGNAHSALIVDLQVLDGFFFGTTVETDLEVGTPVVVDNFGDARSHKIIVRLDGPLSNPVITNSSFSPEVWMKVGTDLATGDYILLDVDQMTAVRNSDGANLIGAVTRSGMRQWLGLRRGNNTLTLTTDVVGQSGTATIFWNPPYFP